MTLARRGVQAVGTLHLTPHHIVFFATPSQSPETAQTQGTPARPKELWIGYPIISFCTYRPNPAVSRQPSSIRLRCRDFNFVCFYFTAENKGREVYESIRSRTCKIGRVDRLYAFTFQPPLPEREFDGWQLYDPSKELARQGVVSDGRTWRISQINSDYGVCLVSLDLKKPGSQISSFLPRTLPCSLCLLAFRTTPSIMPDAIDLARGYPYLPTYTLSTIVR